MKNLKVRSPWPCYSQEEIDAASACLATGAVNYWTGSECREFEKEFASYHGMRHGIALANGTVALELALLALGVGEGDEVIVTPRSFFASASCVARVGATAVFADVNRDSQNVTAESIAAVATKNTKAVIPVHLAGWPCDMPAICEWAAEKNVAVIEDCAQAHGAKIDGRAVGSFGDVSAFSFCQDKIMTTAGEGGMILTNSEAIWRKAWAFKDHGKSWRKIYETEHPPGFRWLHESFGTNWRMAEFQGAIGRVQLRNLDDSVADRNRYSMQLVERLSESVALRVPRPRDGIRHACYKFYAFVKPERLVHGWSRDRILTELEAAGCPGWSGACPEIYREAAFAGHPQPDFATCRELGETSIMLPVHPTLSRREVEFMGETLLEIMRKAAGH